MESVQGVDQQTATTIRNIIEEDLEGKGPEACWERLTNEVLGPETPQQTLVEVFREVYGQDDQFSDAPPAWKPSSELVSKSNIKRLCQAQGHTDFEEFFEWSITHRKDFWDTMIRELDILPKGAYEAVVEVDESLETPTWLKGANYNIAASCFQQQGDKPAIIYGDEQGNQNAMSYDALESYSNRIANGLNANGFGKGDRAAIDMPMTADAVAIYLGIVKAGGAVVSIADSLAPKEVEKRLRIAQTKLVFTQDVIPRGKKELPLYQKLLDTELPQTVVLNGTDELKVDLREGDLSFQAFLSDKEDFEPVPCSSEDLCNVLFSSGTTGDPKAIPWTHATPIKCAVDGHIHHDIQEGEVVAWPTNIGWMMGPWLIFASLLNKGTIALFYGAPSGQAFGTFVQDAKVNMLGVIPSMVKSWIDSDCMKGLDWSHIKLFSSTGEASNPQDYLWLMARAGWKPVIEYCGGTEIGGGYATGTIVESASPSSFTTPTCGLDIFIADEDGEEAEEGELFLVPPSMGLSNTLLNKDHHKTYYEDVPIVKDGMRGTSGINIVDQVKEFGPHPILRRHGDELKVLSNGRLRPQGRADDTMNLGGIKTSSVEIERLLDLVDGVKETAAIAVAPPSGGPSQLVIYAVLQGNADWQEADLKKDFQRVIKEQLNPLFKIADVVLRESLPRTASNKVMRRVLRKEYG